jgi:hypothetical protein
MPQPPEKDPRNDSQAKRTNGARSFSSKFPAWLTDIGAPLVLLAVVYLGVILVPNLQEHAKAQQDQGEQQGQRERDDPIGREAWFYKQRAFPRATIPEGANERAQQRLKEMIELQNQLPPQGAALAGGAAAGTPGIGPWTAIGPQPSSATGTTVGSVSGRVVALAVDPTDPNIVYAGGAFGGVWKTIDGGANWTPITESEVTQAIGSIAIDPTSCNPAPCKTIYVGTGEENFAIESYYGAGILKSTDAGQHWTQVGQGVFVGPFSSGFSPGGGARIGALAVNPSNGNLLLAAVQIFSVPASSTSGIYCSNDGGTTWAVLPGVSNAPGIDVQFANASTAYASLGRVLTGTNGANGVYKSTNAGAACASQTWTRTALAAPGGTGALLDSTTTGRIAIGVSLSDPNTVYAGIQDPSSTNFGRLLGFFKTTNGGTTWTQLQVGASPRFDYCNPQCWYDNVVRVDPRNSSVVYVGGSAVTNYFARSTDGGSTWQQFFITSGVQLHVDQHALSFGLSGGTPTVYVGNDGGIWKSPMVNATDTPSWTNLNATLNITQFYPGFSTHPSTPQQGIGGTQDNGTILYTGSPTWSEVTCGDGGWTIIDPVVPSTVYGTCQNIDIRKSVQNGARGTFVSADNGINASDNGAFIPPFVMDPSNHARLYFGTYRLWQSNDGAANWTAISGDLTRGGGSSSGGPTLTTIAAAPTNPQFVYVGSSDGCVRASTDAQSNPATFTGCFSGLPIRSVTQVVVDPADASIAYVTFSGFSCFTPPGGSQTCDGFGHVFRTTSTGNTWFDISGSGTGTLPDTPVNDLVIDPDDPSHFTLYAATDVGVFQTTDVGTTWTPMNPAQAGVPGLPHVTVLSLRLHEPSRTLRAATHGRGVWDFPLADLAGTPAFRLSAIAPTSAAAGAATLLLTVTGQGFTANSTIRWNGSAAGVTMQPGGSATQLSALIDASMLTQGSAVPVTVVDTNPSLGTTNALVFTVTAPTPSITSLAPSTATACGLACTQPLTLTVNGTNFNVGSQVLWNGSGLATTFVGAGQVQAIVPASFLQFGGSFAVSVVNPAPGGGTSKSLAFTVTAGTPPANDNFVNATSATLDGTNHFVAAAVDSSSATTEGTDPILTSFSAPSCFTSTAGLVGNGTSKSVWYKWTATASGSMTADTIGSSYDTILAVVTGSPGSFTEVACNDDINPGVDVQSTATFNVTQGTTYFFMVSAFSGDGGKSNFNLALVATPDFTLSASPTSANSSPGGSSTYTITVTPSGGFNSAVTLSCTNLPAVLTCGTFNPTSVTPGTTPNNSATVSVTASASALVPAPPGLRHWPRVTWPWILFVGVALALAWLAARSRVPRRKRALAYASGAAFLLLLSLQVVGCSKGSGGGGGGGGGTTPRTYTITVTGTSGGTSHTTSATLIVQ